MSTDTVDRQLDGVVTNQLAVALFANRAFLVEGTTESSVFYGIGDKTSFGSLEASGLSIVPVGGKTSIPLAHAILVSIGIPVYALFDADSGFEARAKAKGKTQDKIDAEQNSHVAANRALLKYFGRTVEDFPTAIVADAVAIFEDCLEELLSANWPEWITACNNVEAAAGISLAKNQLAYRTATLEASGTIPEMLSQILRKAVGGVTLRHTTLAAWLVVHRAARAPDGNVRVRNALTTDARRSVHHARCRSSMNRISGSGSFCV
ncbi:ATP-dependent endonuclease [Dyella tabacisoli]|uniref:ATP-dependent endonuclease n=1 Tax=Dyella tabacisoli TaxID=2282381 RepID=UPI001CDB6F33|nr:ATP-dependent endonuclease [Dyella tabacisoli]